MITRLHTWFKSLDTTTFNVVALLVNLSLYFYWPDSKACLFWVGYSTGFLVRDYISRS